MKKIQRTIRNVPQHWVGDGFPVRSFFSYNEDAAEISPFLLLDYGGPHEFAPTEQQLGVGEHPHRGFETVTIVYQGGLEHRDSTGGHGTIGPGDVQWMTAWCHWRVASVFVLACELLRPPQFSGITKRFFIDRCSCPTRKSRSKTYVGPRDLWHWRHASGTRRMSM